MAHPLHRDKVTIPALLYRHSLENDYHGTELGEFVLPSSQYSSGTHKPFPHRYSFSVHSFISTLSQFSSSIPSVHCCMPVKLCMIEISLKAMYYHHKCFSNPSTKVHVRSQSKCNTCVGAVTAQAIQPQALILFHELYQQMSSRHTIRIGRSDQMRPPLKNS